MYRFMILTMFALFSTSGQSVTCPPPNHPTYTVEYTAGPSQTSGEASCSNTNSNVACCNEAADAANLAVIALINEERANCAAAGGVSWAVLDAPECTLQVANSNCTFNTTTSEWDCYYEISRDWVCCVEPAPSPSPQPW